MSDSEPDIFGYRLHFSLSDEPIIIWDDPPPDPDRDFDHEALHDWWVETVAARRAYEDHAVRCATWLFPAAAAALAAGLVYLSYRMARR